MSVAGDYIGRVRLGVTIGAAGDQSFTWPAGRPAGVYTADGGPDSTIALTVTEPDADTITVAWGADDSRLMIGHPWRVLRDGTWLFGDLYVTEAEPVDQDPTEYSVLDGTVEVTVAMIAPTGGGGGASTADDVTVADGTMPTVEAAYPPATDSLTDYLAAIDEAIDAGGGGGGDVFTDVANMFTEAQSIDLTVPVTPLANVGTTKPTVLLHMHDQSGPIIDYFAGSVDFGGGVIIRSTGTLTRQVGVDGDPTDTWFMQFYSFGGAGFRPVFAEVESTDPGELPWLGDMLSAVSSPVRVGEPTEDADATTKAYVDDAVSAEATARGDADTVLTDDLADEIAARQLTVVAVGPTAPVEPDAPASAVWLRTEGDLRAFVDFAEYPGGPLDTLYTNGIGSEGVVVLRSFESLGAPFQPALIITGTVTSDQVTPNDDDSTPRTGFTLYQPNGDPLAPGNEGRIEWGHGGFDATGGTLTTYVPTNVAISDDDGNAYLMGVVVGRFVGSTDATDPGSPISARMRLIRDDLAAPTTIASAALPRLPIAADRFGFTWDADGHLAGHMNGAQIVAVTETTHDISTFTGIGMPMHQGSDTVAWEDAYYTKVAWFGISGGDEILRRTGPHTWAGAVVDGGIGWGSSVQTLPMTRRLARDVTVLASGFTGNLSSTDTTVQTALATIDALSIGGGGGAVDSVNGETGAVVLDAADVGAIASTLPDAKGDLVAASAADTPARLAVGTNGQLLTAASGETTGLAWASATNGVRKIARDAYLWDTISGSQTWNVDTATAQGGGFVGGEAINDYTEWVEWLDAGTWTLELWHIMSTANGVMTIALDGVALGATVDGYNGSTTRNNRVTRTGVVVETSGTHTLRVSMLSKNASSSSYRSGVQHYAWRRTA